jgi:hypothetical protein
MPCECSLWLRVRRFFKVDSHTESWRWNSFRILTVTLCKFLVYYTFAHSPTNSIVVSTARTISETLAHS